MTHSNAAHFHLYTASSDELSALKDIISEWESSGSFWGFDILQPTLMRPDTLLFYYREDADPKWRGVVFIHNGIYEADLLYIYVSPKYRQQGLALFMLDEVIAYLERSTTAEALFLEVRVSNIAAQALYKTMGFEQTGIRKKYYADGEDAFLYKKTLHRIPT